MYIIKFEPIKIQSAHSITKLIFSNVFKISFIDLSKQKYLKCGGLLICYIYVCIHAFYFFLIFEWQVKVKKRMNCLLEYIFVGDFYLQYLKKLAFIGI